VRLNRTLFVTLLLAAAVVAAQSPGSTASRRAFLWRALDSWSLPISQAVMMQQDPFASVRAQAAGVMASNVDTKRLPLLIRYMNDGDARVREQVMLAAGRMGKPGLRLAVHGLADSTPLVRQAAAWNPASEPLAARGCALAGHRGLVCRRRRCQPAKGSRLLVVAHR